MTTHEWLVTGFTTLMAVGTWIGAWYANRSANRAAATLQKVSAMVILAGSIRDEHVAKIYSHVRIVKGVAEQTGNMVLVQQADELLAQEKRSS